MKSKVVLKFLKIIVFLVTGIIIISCSNKVVISLDQMQRLNLYLQSENEHVAGMFFEEDMLSSGIQPALTQKEVDILDALADRIDPEVRKGFDQKYTAWLYCWAMAPPLDLSPLLDENARIILNCNGQEFQELIEFCRQQDEDIFLLLYQLAARAQCPYDRYLLEPAYDLLENFPEFSKYWQEVDLSLQREKPEKNRTCNESTIWYTRKFLETKYGFTYTNELTNFFGTLKML